VHAQLRWTFVGAKFKASNSSVPTNDGEFGFRAARLNVARQIRLFAFAPLSH
jgi:hypothetical protein